jgi:hypothetical protein
MAKTKSTTVKEEVRISFSGLGADEGTIYAADLAKALSGWHAFWEISTSIFLNEEFSTKPLEYEMRPQIKIRSFERNSFDIISVIIIPLALMVGYDFAKALWKWRRSLLNKHVENKKNFITREEAIETLKMLAKASNIRITETIEIVKVMDTIDDSLNDLVEPIDHSAKRVIISSNSDPSKIQLTSGDKQALKGGYHVSSEEYRKGFEKNSVKFIRINSETGNAIITFDNPNGIHKMGHEFSQIIDPMIREPKNVYTKAFYEGTSLEVWGRIIRSRRSNKFVRWEITADIPQDNAPLFDKL